MSGMKCVVKSLQAAAVAACLLLPAALWAQSEVAQAAKTQQQKDAQKPETKKPHVWTNDDLPKATEATVSVPSVAPPPPAPGESKSAASAAAEGGPATAGQPGGPAKPAMDVKTAEDKLKSAQRDVDETKKVIDLLQVRMASEEGSRRESDAELLLHSQQRLPQYEDNLKQAQKDYDDAQKAAQQQKGQPGQAGAQPTPPPPPPPQL